MLEEEKLKNERNEAKDENRSCCLFGGTDAGICIWDRQANVDGKFCKIHTLKINRLSKQNGWARGVLQQVGVIVVCFSTQGMKRVFEP